MKPEARKLYQVVKKRWAIPIKASHDPKRAHTSSSTSEAPVGPIVLVIMHLGTARTFDDDDIPIAELHLRTSSLIGQSSEQLNNPPPVDDPSLRTNQGKDKAPQIYIESEGEHWAEEEPKSYIDLNDFTDESGLENSEQAHRFLKAIILLRDWETTKVH